MKNIILISFLWLVSLEGFSQSLSKKDSLYTPRQSSVKARSDKRCVYSGNVSFQPKPLFINASPLIGYRFTDNLIAGLGPSYMYNKQGLATSISTTGGKGSPMHVYGGRVFASRRVYKQLFLQAESEALNYPYLTPNSTGSPSVEKQSRTWVVNPLAGLSYNLALGGQSFFQMTVLYNFNYYNDPFNRQLYNSPWVFRMGAGIGKGKSDAFI